MALVHSSLRARPTDRGVARQHRFSRFGWRTNTLGTLVFFESSDTMKRLRLQLPALLCVLVIGSAWAQDTTVIQAENVRFAYAQVLRVSPIYQTLTATSVEEKCAPTPNDDKEGGSPLARVVGAVKDVLSRQPEDAATQADCEAVSVQHEFRRPIAYDVDYVYKGSKYRSRLPDDPGNRLRIRIGVTPVVTGSRSH